MARRNFDSSGYSKVEKFTTYPSAADDPPTDPSPPDDPNIPDDSSILWGWSFGLFVGGGFWIAFAILVWQLPWLNWVAIFDSNYESRWWGLLAILANYGALMPWIGSFLCAYWAFFRTPLWRRHEMSGWSFVVFFFGPFWLWLFFIGIPTIRWWAMMFGITLGPEGEYLGWAWALFIPAVFLTLMGATPMLGGLYGFFIGFEEEPFLGEFGDRNLSSGMKGDDVTRLQEILNAAHEEKIGVDGSFGSQTEGAVKAFQEEDGLTVDGIVGKMTSAALQVIEIVETIDGEDTDEDIVQAETAFQKLISDMPFDVEQAIQKIWKRRLGLKIESLTIWWE